MFLDARAVTEEIDALLALVEVARRASPHDDLSGGLPRDQMHALRTRLDAGVRRLAPADTVYTEKAQEAGPIRDGAAIVRLAGILQALRADVEAGYVRTLEELVRADVFADFIGMAEELLSKGYKDAAAVITGSVLEEHLRKLAGKLGVAAATGGRPLKADTMNAELVKAGAYNKLTQKSVTALLDLRNNAAHGHYGEYDAAQVAAMIRDVQSLAERFPA